MKNIICGYEMYTHEPICKPFFEYDLFDMVSETDHLDEKTVIENIRSMYRRIINIIG